MTSLRWTETNYARVPSFCMNNNGGHFYTRDLKGFEKYLVKVKSGKNSIGVTMLPLELTHDTSSCLDEP